MRFYKNKKFSITNYKNLPSIMNILFFLAGNYNIPEVTVYFNHKLMRGNRTIKVNNSRIQNLLIIPSLT